MFAYADLVPEQVGRVQNGGMYCASVAHPPDSEGFDFEYFRDHHAPMLAELLGANCVRFEVHRALAVTMAGSESSFLYRRATRAGG